MKLLSGTIIVFLVHSYAHVFYTDWIPELVYFNVCWLHSEHGIYVLSI